MTLLSVTELSASLGGAAVLHDISFEVAPGELIGLVGPNGAGKSTLLKAVLDLTPAGGKVLLEGQSVRAMKADARARIAAYLPQERDVAWPVPVEMLVALGRAPYCSPFAPLAKNDLAVVESAMRIMDVEAFRSRAATDLSGGELARVLVARALAQNTPLLLADEPTAGLDPAHQIALMRTFAKLAAECRTVIASLHDLGLAARWCSRLLVLQSGRIVADGPPDALLAGGQLQAVYGVEIHAEKIAGRWVVQPLDVIRSQESDHERT
jgi:iron complex transport system ATP-binding protein